MVIRSFIILFILLLLEKGMEEVFEQLDIKQTNVPLNEYTLYKADPDDSKYSVTRHLFVIPSNHHAIPIYDKIRPELLIALSNQNHFSLGLWLYGFENSLLPTILIICENPSKFIKPAGMPYILELLIREGATYRYCDDPGNNPVRNDLNDFAELPERAFPDYVKTPDCGASLGKSCNGSLGGYFISEEKEIFATTCCHVVPKKNMESIFQPSPTYLNHHILILEQLKSSDEEVKRMSDDRFEKPHTKITRRIEEYKDKIENLKSIDFEFGSFTYGEQDQVEVDGVLVERDWALLKVKEGRVGNNNVEVSGKKVEVLGIRRIKDNMRVRKFGARTGTTSGMVNGKRSDVKVWPSKIPTTEWTIKGDSGEFCSGGDSGSWVIDQSDHVCGVLFAGSEAKKNANETKRESVSFVSDIYVLKSWMEEKSGKSFSLKPSNL